MTTAGLAAATDEPQHWLTVKGGMLPYWTSGTGPAVVLVHGWTLDHRVWEPQVAALATHFAVTTFDRRGFGRSRAPADSAQEPDDLIRLIDHIGAQRAAIVAMSQGTRVALTVAARLPDRVDRLVLQGAPFPLSRPLADIADEGVPIAEMRRLAGLGDHAAVRALWLSHALMQVDGDAPNAIMQKIIEDYNARDLDSIQRPLELDIASIEDISAPTLLVTGATDSPMRRATATCLATLLSHCTVVEIVAAGHLCNLEQPAAYNLAVREFLSMS
jgi:pimeloyl-ACP methyl ester carboxylesterase